MSDTVRQVKEKLSIQDVVGSYVKLERRGSTLRARCPFHNEKTPSFFISPERGTYHCFGCNVGGDIFSFVEAIEGLDFKGALKVLAERAGVPLVYERGTKKDETDRLYELMEVATLFYISQISAAAREYLARRGVHTETINSFRLGLAHDGWSSASEYLRGKGFTEKELVDAGLAKRGDRGTLTDKFRNRIMFPIADSAGRVVAFSGRIFGEKAHPDAPKYLNSPETLLFKKSRILYGFDRAKQVIRKYDCAVLVEGQIDLLMSHQAGWENTVAVSGTAFTNDHALIIKRMTDNLVIALDADEAGIKAATRAARAALQSGLNVKVARLPEGSDPADMIQKNGPDAWRTSIREAQDIITFLLDIIEIRAPKKDQFRRMVEAVVLPFLVDVKSPIAQEQYVREVAGRLGVSEEAVKQSLRDVPRTESVTVAHEPVPVSVHDEASPASERAQHAYSLLLWQKSLAKPSIDCVSFERDLRDALGEEVFSDLVRASEHRGEKLRFSAERVLEATVDLARESVSLIALLKKERLARELEGVTARLRAAETRGNDDEVETLMRESRVLTGEIAKIQ